MHTREISAYRHTKENGSKEELLVLKYNLDNRVQEQYQYIFLELDNTLC